MQARKVFKESLFPSDYIFLKEAPEYGVNFGFHYHNFYEVHFYLNAKGSVRLQNKTEYEITSGDILMLNMDESHEIMFDRDHEKRRFCFAIDPKFLLNACAVDCGIFTNKNPKYPIIQLDTACFEKLSNIFSDLYRLAPDVGHGTPILKKALTYEILSILVDEYYFESVAGSHLGRAAAVANDLMEYIDQHLAEELTLETLAAKVNFSKFHMSRIFKKHTGVTLNRYIINRRLQKAKELLKEDIPINEVGHLVGFNNYSYFYKTLKKAEGMTPSAFKKSILEK